jgi:hypothetical protein
MNKCEVGSLKCVWSKKFFARLIQNRDLLSLLHIKNSFAFIMKDKVLVLLMLTAILLALNHNVLQLSVSPWFK